MNDATVDAEATLAPPAARGMAGRLVRAAQAAEKAIEACCNGALLLSGMALLVILTLTVVMRYGWASSMDSGPELVALIFPVFVMAGIVSAARHGAHIATQVLMYSLGPAWRRRLALFIHGVTVVAYVYIGWYAFQNAIIAHEEQSTILRVPGSVGYGSLAAALFLVAGCSVAAMIRHGLGAEPVRVDFADAPGSV